MASGSLIGRTGRQQNDIDELARMERRCRELAAGAASLEERDALLELAGSYRAATQAPPTSKLPVARDRQFSAKSLRLLGRSGRARTCDPRFWRPVLYQLSYTPTDPASP